MSDKKLDISNTRPEPTSSTLSSLSSSPLVSSTFEQENKEDFATNNLEVGQLLNSWRLFSSTWVKAVNTNSQQHQQENLSSSSSSNKGLSNDKEIQDLLQARKALLQRIHSLEATLEGKAEDLHAVQFAVESDSSCFYNSYNQRKLLIYFFLISNHEKKVCNTFYNKSIVSFFKRLKSTFFSTLSSH